MKKVGILFLALIIANVCLTKSWGQGSPTTGQIFDSLRRPITTAVPFLLIPSDARAAGMGDVGVATSPDAFATHWNPAKLAFVDNQFGVALSYTPWLRQLVNDMAISHLSGYYKFSDKEAVSLAMTYFDMGDINFTDNFGNPMGDYRPREFAVRSHYSRKLTENLGLSIGAFWVHSNIANLFFTGNGATGQAKPGNSGGVDIGAFYQKQGLNLAGTELDFALGAAITNLGAKISYTGDNQRDFLPTNFRIGGSGTLKLDELNKISAALDLNKLLVPTPSPNRLPRDIGLLSGLFSSFGDAPDGIKEELQEFMMNFGAEYVYNDMFMGRLGLAMEHKNKGDRKYATIGLGARYNVFGLDVAYMIPFKRTNPLTDTFRVTLMVNFGGKEKPSAPPPAESE
jgi:hypothetical protein